MKLYSSEESYKLYQGNMLDLETCIKPNSIDSVVTDPPYELGFMGKGWDSSGVAFQKETWQHCLNVLKPGGYLLAFGGSRTFHRITCAIEDAGFEIRDVIMWIYGSGFPKSMNLGLAIDKKNGVESKIVGYEKTSMPDFRDVGKKQKEASGVDKLTFGQIENSERKQQPIFQAQNEWGGWGTALKPSYEPIIVARKPCEGSCIDNVLHYGVGGINIDECRVENTSADTYDLERRNISKATGSDNDGHFLDALHNVDFKKGVTDKGRYPANTILTYDESDHDQVCAGFPSTKSTKTNSPLLDIRGNNYNNATKTLDRVYERGYEDSGSAARYFYCAKASKKDRNEGLDSFETKQCTGGGGGIGDYLKDVNSCSGKFGSEKAPHKNTHPTVKPTDLMQYLIRLVTPDNGVVLDPFNGSGSTGKAAMYENKERGKNYKYIGIEMTEEYLPIAKARIEYVLGIEEKEEPTGQMTIFDIWEVESGRTV